MKILERTEWTDEQRTFLQANPELAIKAEGFLNYLDEKEAFLKARQRKNPMYWVNWYLGLIKNKAH